MKATDLMCGDWVYCYGKLTKITMLTNADIIATEIGDGVITPIPLTPEILERNGFNPDTFLTAEWEKEVYFKEFPGCVVEPDDSGKYIFGITIYWNKKDGDGSPIDWGTMYESRIYNLQYVHTLQHALRLCGLNELADNFKI